MYIFLIDDAQDSEPYGPEDFSKAITEKEIVLNKGKEDKELEEILKKKILLKDLKD